MIGTSERTTADEPTKEIDPGGTRPTKPADRRPEQRKTEQPTRSGDQNQKPSEPDRF